MSVIIATPVGRDLGQEAEHRRQHQEVGERAADVEQQPAPTPAAAAPASSRAGTGPARRRPRPGRAATASPPTARRRTPASSARRTAPATSIAISWPPLGSLSSSGCARPARTAGWRTAAARRTPAAPRHRAQQARAQLRSGGRAGRSPAPSAHRGSGVGHRCAASSGIALVDGARCPSLSISAVPSAAGRPCRGGRSGACVESNSPAGLALAPCACRRRCRATSPGRVSRSAALQFVGGQFALELGLHRIPLRARAAHPQAGEARGLGQALGAEHEQGDDRDDQQFAETDVEHRACRSTRRGAGLRTSVALGVSSARGVSSCGGALAALVARWAGCASSSSCMPFLKPLTRFAEVLADAAAGAWCRTPAPR